MEFTVGREVVLHQRATYPTEVTIVAITIGSMCIKLHDAGETLLVFYREGEKWHDGMQSKLYMPNRPLRQYVKFTEAK